MKGVIFTEFMEFVEDSFGFDVLDELISEAEKIGGGVYTQLVYTKMKS